LVSPVTTGTAGLAGGTRHRLDDARQIGERQALFEDEAGSQIERRRAEHGDVVDRAVDRQATDIAAGKEQRRNDMPVGGHHQPARRYGHHRAVVALPEKVVAEMLGEQLLDQLCHGPAAAAMRHVDRPWRRSSGRT
jgi:hypothetical protein